MAIGGCATMPQDGGGDDGTGSGATGSPLPADLVGQWGTAGLSAAISYEFSADGQVVYAGKLDSSYSCTDTTEISYQGTVQLAGNVLTIQPTDGTVTDDYCGTVTTKPYTRSSTMAYQIGTGDQGPVLTLTDQATGDVLVLPRED
ncbi:MAG TPA: hypothetical protein VLX92_16280 [Kofleriaceae bacterium]|nr:hypothetical protein [Kofleriaceae bacterium]